MNAFKVNVSDFNAFGELGAWKPELVDRQAARGESRSEAIEGLLREGLALRLRRAADARDLMLLNRNAEALNAEMADVLEYQDEL